MARLSTLSPDGQPHQVPVVFAWHAGSIWSPIDAKPKRSGELARVRNIRHEPRVSLLLDHYDDDWSRLWWLRIAGQGEILQPDHPESDPALAPVLDHLRAKYPAYREIAVLIKPPTLIRIEPAQVRSWCAGPEALEQPR